MSIDLVLVSGLPCVGKTTLSKQLCDYFLHNESIKAVVISFDEILDEQVERDLVKSGEWKSGRILIKTLVHRLVECIKHGKVYSDVLTDSGDRYDSVRVNFKTLTSTIKPDDLKTQYILIIDDNFYYTSMRYEYYKLAVELQCSYMNICIRPNCDVDTLVQRNANRLGVDRVDEETLRRMYNHFEYPSDSWELQFSQVASEFGIPDLVKLIGHNRLKFEQFMSDKLDLNSYKAHLAEIAQKSSANLIHQCDLALRKRVSECLKKTRIESRVDMASRLARVKIEVMEELRDECNSLSGSMQEIMNKYEERFDQLLNKT